MKNKSILVMTGCLVLAAATCALAYQENTHRGLTEAALSDKRCTVHEYLRDELLMPSGMNTVIAGVDLREHAMRGAVEEDAWIRPLHHFFNPLRDGIRPNSLDWGWNNSDNTDDWQNAREAQKRWLTSSTPFDRAKACAEMFNKLGHIMHLMQDCAVPAHVRSDEHLTDPSIYEDYCEDEYGINVRYLLSVRNVDLPQPRLFDPSTGRYLIPSATPLRFRALWDTDQYTGQTYYRGFRYDPGLAEFTNYYFLSDDTFFSTCDFWTYADGLKTVLSPRVLVSYLRLPYPRIEDTNLGWIKGKLGSSSLVLERAGELPVPAPGSFYLMNGNGVHNLFSVQLTRTGTTPARGRVCLTEDNYESYARSLLPRAVTYSEALDNLFFRTHLTVVQKDNDEEKQQYAFLADSADKNQFGKGGFELYHDTPTGLRWRVPGFTMSKGKITFPARPELATGLYTLVYAGPLHEEPNGVCAKAFKLTPAYMEGKGSLGKLNVKSFYVSRFEKRPYFEFDAWFDYDSENRAYISRPNTNQWTVSHSTDYSEVRVTAPSNVWVGNIARAPQPKFIAHGTLTIKAKDYAGTSKDKLEVQFIGSYRKDGNTINYSFRYSGVIRGHITLWGNKVG